MAGEVAAAGSVRAAAEAAEIGGDQRRLPAARPVRQQAGRPGLLQRRLQRGMQAEHRAQVPRISIEAAEGTRGLDQRFEGQVGVGGHAAQALAPRSARLGRTASARLPALDASRQIQRHPAPSPGLPSRNPTTTTLCRLRVVARSRAGEAAKLPTIVN
jgi:hypothetical protein